MQRRQKVRGGEKHHGTVYYRLCMCVCVCARTCMCVVSFGSRIESHGWDCYLHPPLRYVGEGSQEMDMEMMLQIAEMKNEAEVL